MKKARVIATAITAASLAISCAALVACTDPVDPDKSYDITFDANGGAYADGTTTVLKTDDNGRVAAKPNDPVWAEHIFASYNTAEDGTGTEITFGASGYQFSADTTVYAQWTEIKEYTVTFDANGGTLPEGASNTATTVSGKISSFPTPTTDAELSFGGWYTAATGGTVVTSSTVISADTTVYAHWVEGGLYTADGKFVAELVKSTPTDSAVTQYGASGIELAPGDVLKIVIKGVTLTHADELGLWTDGGCHGINFDQSAATFTVKDGAERAFDVYAKYYTDGTPCWSIYMSDGLTDADLLVEGGAYLCGQGWTNSDWNNAVPENYIDPENGLTVTFSSDAQFKIAQCINGAREWNYNNPSLYKMAEGKEEGYLNLAVSATANGTVLAAGEYTITVVGEGDDISFVFTPGKDVKPAELEDKYVAGGCYLVGTKFAGDDLYAVNEQYYIDSDSGLTVNLPKGSVVQVVECKSATTGGENWIFKNASQFSVVDGDAYIKFSGGNGTVVTGGEYTVTVSGEGDERIITFTHATDLEPDTTVVTYNAYFVGQNLLVGGTNLGSAWSINSALFIDPENGLTITFTADSTFKIVADDEGSPNYNVYNFSNCAMAEGSDGSLSEGGNWSVTAGTYKITRDDSGEQTIFYFEKVDAAE